MTMPESSDDKYEDERTREHLWNRLVKAADTRDTIRYRVTLDTTAEYEARAVAGMVKNRHFGGALLQLTICFDEAVSVELDPAASPLGKTVGRSDTGRIYMVRTSLGGYNHPGLVLLDAARWVDEPLVGVITAVEQVE